MIGQTKFDLGITKHAARLAPVTKTAQRGAAPPTSGPAARSTTVYRTRARDTDHYASRGGTR